MKIRKKIVLTLIFVVALSVLSVEIALASCVNPPPDLVSWWPGDGNTQDIVDSNPGTLKPGAGYAPGKVGQAFSFDGTLNNRVEGPPDTVGSNLDITGQFTLDAWVKFEAVTGAPNPADDAGNSPIVAKWGNTTFGTAGYGIFVFA